MDISKQARALTWLRGADYALLGFGGFVAVSMLAELVVDAPSNVLTLLFHLLQALFLCFAAYTGWRHVGMIDPAVWKAYRLVLPLFALFCLYRAWDTLAQCGCPVAELLDKEDDFLVTWMFFSMGGVSLLGWISLMRLGRMNITPKGATVDQVLLRLGKYAGTRAC